MCVVEVVRGVGVEGEVWGYGRIVEGMLDSEGLAGRWIFLF